MLEVNPQGILAGADDVDEVLVAVILNQTLDIQLRAALSSVASYLARHEVVGRVRAGELDATNLGRFVADVDRQIATMLDDTLRVKDWRAAAMELRERSLAADLSLRVQFGTPLLGAVSRLCVEFTTNSRLPDI